CSPGPMAPTSTRMRCDRRSRRARADSFRSRMGETGHFSLPIAAKVKGARDGPRPPQVVLRDVLQTPGLRSFSSRQSTRRKACSDWLYFTGFSTGHEAGCIKRAFWGVEWRKTGAEGSAQYGAKGMLDLLCRFRMISFD